jgi:hypothetical protein
MVRELLLRGPSQKTVKAPVHLLGYRANRNAPGTLVEKPNLLGGYLAIQHVGRGT